MPNQSASCWPTSFLAELDLINRVGHLVANLIQLHRSGAKGVVELCSPCARFCPVDLQQAVAPAQLLQPLAEALTAELLFPCLAARRALRPLLCSMAATISMSRCRLSEASSRISSVCSLVTCCSCPAQHGLIPTPAVELTGCSPEPAGLSRSVPAQPDWPQSADWISASISSVFS